MGGQNHFYFSYFAAKKNAIGISMWNYDDKSLINNIERLLESDMNYSRIIELKDALRRGGRNNSQAWRAVA